MSDVQTELQLNRAAMNTRERRLMQAEQRLERVFLYNSSLFGEEND